VCEGECVRVSTSRERGADGHKGGPSEGQPDRRSSRSGAGDCATGGAPPGGRCCGGRQAHSSRSSRSRSSRLAAQRATRKAAAASTQQHERSSDVRPGGEAAAARSAAEREVPLSVSEVRLSLLASEVQRAKSPGRRAACARERSARRDAAAAGVGSAAAAEAPREGGREGGRRGGGREAQHRGRARHTAARGRWRLRDMSRTRHGRQKPRELRAPRVARPPEVEHRQAGAVHQRQGRVVAADTAPHPQQPQRRRAERRHRRARQQVAAKVERSQPGEPVDHGAHCCRVERYLAVWKLQRDELQTSSAQHAEPRGAETVAVGDPEVREGTEAGSEVGGAVCGEAGSGQVQGREGGQSRAAADLDGPVVIGGGDGQALNVAAPVPEAQERQRRRREHGLRSGLRELRSDRLEQPRRERRRHEGERAHAEQRGRAPRRIGDCLGERSTRHAKQRVRIRRARWRPHPQQRHCWRRSLLGQIVRPSALLPAPTVEAG